MSTSPKTASPNKKELLKKRLLSILKNNLGIKILSLLLALVFWAVLITQDATLTREKVFTDVTVSVSGSDTMKRNGYIVVSDIDSLLKNVTVRAEVPQKKYSEATASAYNVRVDLSRVNETGTLELRLQSTTSSAYGSVTEISPATIPVEVEAYTTRYRIPVTLTTEGEMAEGYYAGSATADPSLISVSGPKSVVDQIVRARAVINLEDIPAEEGTYRSAVTFELIDRHGDVVENDQIEVMSESVLLDSVIVEQTVYATKELQFSDSGMVKGSPADGYEIKSVYYTPETIVAAGNSEDLAVLDTLFAGSEIDVSDLTESLTKTIKIRRPTELVKLSPDTVTVEIEIGPVISSKTYPSLRVKVNGAADGLKSSMDTRSISVTVTGP